MEVIFLAKNIIKALFTSRGYSISEFAKDNDIDYQRLLRRINSERLELTQIKLMIEKLNLTENEILSIFLPIDFKK
jgi:Fic family protein